MSERLPKQQRHTPENGAGKFNAHGALIGFSSALVGGLITEQVARRFLIDPYSFDADRLALLFWIVGAFAVPVIELCIYNRIHRIPLRDTFRKIIS